MKNSPSRFYSCQDLKSLIISLLCLMLISFQLHAQTLNSVNPNKGQIGDIMNVTISGQNVDFTVGTSSIQTEFKQGNTSISASFISSTVNNLVVLLDLSNTSYPSGKYDLSVNTSNHGLLSLSDAYTIDSAAIENVSPSNAIIGQVVDVLITGRNIDFTTITVPPVYVGGGDSIATTILGTRGSDTLEIRVDLNAQNLKVGNYDLTLFAPGDTLIFRNGLKLRTTNISGVVFFDPNSNGIQDSNELGFRNIKVQLLPDSNIAITNPDGQYSFDDLKTGSYQVVLLPPDSTVITTPPDTQSIVISGPESFDATFGLNSTAKSILNKVNSRIYSGIARCGRNVSYSLFIRNDGFTSNSGIFSMVKDANIDYDTSSTSLADSTRGDTIYFSFSNLSPGQEIKQIVRCNIPGISILPLGTNITAEIEAVTFDTSGSPIPSTLSNDDDATIIRCSYDPNDKLVTPEGLDTVGYVLHDTRLEYTIRFQNTGNDTAFLVVLQDTLSDYLDVNTFELIAESHTVLTTLRANGILTFTFEDILLVDSTTNEPESNGFVRFSISPKSGLADSTVIENGAAIYFDFNPPIITNRVINTFVSQLPVSIGELKNKLRAKFYPNPSKDGLINIEINKPLKDGQLIVYNLKGQVIKHERRLKGAALQIDLGNQNEGVYFISIWDDGLYMNEKLILY